MGRKPKRSYTNFTRDDEKSPEPNRNSLRAATTSSNANPTREHRSKRRKHNGKQISREAGDEREQGQRSIAVVRAPERSPLPEGPTDTIIESSSEPPTLSMSFNDIPHMVPATMSSDLEDNSPVKSTANTIKLRAFPVTAQTTCISPQHLHGGGSSMLNSQDSSQRMMIPVSPDNNSRSPVKYHQSRSMYPTRDEMSRQMSRSRQSTSPRSRPLFYQPQQQTGQQAYQSHPPAMKHSPRKPRRSVRPSFAMSQELNQRINAKTDECKVSPRRRSANERNEAQNRAHASRSVRSVQTNHRIRENERTAVNEIQDASRDPPNLKDGVSRFFHQCWIVTKTICQMILTWTLIMIAAVSISLVLPMVLFRLIEFVEKSGDQFVIYLRKNGLLDGICAMPINVDSPPLSKPKHTFQEWKPNDLCSMFDNGQMYDEFQHSKKWKVFCEHARKKCPVISQPCQSEEKKKKSDDQESTDFTFRMCQEDFANCSLSLRHCQTRESETVEELAQTKATLANQARSVEEYLKSCECG